jgi:two-component system NtrC family sensor kinase
MMKSFYLILFVAFCVCFKTANGQQTIVFKGENLVIGKDVAILEDTSNRMGIEDVRKATGFVPSKSPVPNLQLSKSNFWLRFTIKNESPSRQMLLSLDYPTLDICEFYYPANGSYL